MKTINTYSFESHKVLYRGIAKKGAFKDQTIEGYGFKVVEGHTYIYGYRAVEPSNDHRWFRVKPDEIIMEVIPRHGHAAARSAAIKRRTEHLADYGTDGLRDANYVS